MIKVLIVDDSIVVQEFMTHLLSSDPDIRVIGTAGTGAEAINLALLKRPDVITMDIHMPIMDGYEAMKIIMEKVPTPIVVVSASSGVNHLENSFRLIEAGALAAVLRPPAIQDSQFEAERKSLIQTVKLMSEIKVIKRFPKQTKSQRMVPDIRQQPFNGTRDIQLLAIGASTGGPLVLQTILSNLPYDLPVPVLIVQHIAKGFVNGFRSWLSATSKIPLVIAKDGERLKPGLGYISPEDYHLGVSKGPKIFLSDHPWENGLCPSADFLFKSVAETMGADAIGILLTGMGRDGAKELKTMREKGALTIAQDQESSVVFGMPGEAVRIGAAEYILPPLKITDLLTEIFKRNP